MTFLENVLGNAKLMFRRSSFWTVMATYAIAWFGMPSGARLEWLAAHDMAALSPYMGWIMLAAIIIGFVFPQIGVTSATIDQAVKNDPVGTQAKLDVAERASPIVDAGVPSVHLPPPPRPFTPPTSTSNESEQHT